MTNQLDVGDLVLCTVDRIERTTVFVTIEETNQEASIILSEIAPGRIRNLRDYVVPKKQIVCKVLRISGSHIELSLRRVTPKEKKQVLEQHKQEKSAISILKTILKENADKTIIQIQEQNRVHDFLQESKENSKKLEKIVGKSNSEKILNILKKQKSKQVEIKKQISLTTTASNGLEQIKDVLGKIKDAEVKYISAGKYSIKAHDTELKKTDNKIQKIIQEIEKQSKKQNIEFSVEGK